MKNFLSEILYPSLSAKPFGFRRNIRLVLITGLICACVLALSNSNRREMLWMAGVFLIALTLNHLGYYFSAGWLTLFGGIIINAAVIYQKSGIRDTSIFGFIVILIFAGLIGGTTGTLSIGALLIGGIIAFGYLEAQGILVNRFTPFNSFQDYLAVALSIF